MPTNPMTEKQAWWTIAEAYGTPREERSSKQWETARCGICHATCVVRDTSDITQRVAEIMWEKVYKDLNGLYQGCMYFCAYSSANDELRALYCLLNYYMLGGMKC